MNERATLPGGQVCEYEPIKGRPGAFRVLWVHRCPECKWEAISPTGGECHEWDCSLNPHPWTR